MLAEFYYPLKKEQLLERPSDNRFWIEENIDFDDLDSKTLKEQLEKNFSEIEEDPKAIMLSKNSTYIFSVLKHFAGISKDTKSFFVEEFTKAFKRYVINLEDAIESFDQYNQNVFRTGLKILVFYSEWLIENHLNDLKGKKKEIKKTRKRVAKENKDLISTANLTKKKGASSVSKKKATANFMDSASKNDKDSNNNNNQNYFFNLETLLKIILKIVQTNIKLIFKNKLIDEDFMNSLIKICFDSLEVLNENKLAIARDRIFEILQIIVTKYPNVHILLIKLSTKIVNLVYNQESLVNNLSEFVYLAINGQDSNMNKLAVDIVQEMSKTIFENETSDSQGLKNVGKFLVNLSEKSPKIMYSNISTLITLFNCESYVIRNSLVEIIMNIIILLLSRVDDIPDAEIRTNYMRSKEKFIEILFDRIYDKNSFCRSKILGTFEKLCEYNTVTYHNYLKLLTETSKRLKDDKSQVRKRALALISRIIRNYAAIYKSETFLTVEEISNLIKVTNEHTDELAKKIGKIQQAQIEISKKYDNMDSNAFGNVGAHKINNNKSENSDAEAEQKQAGENSHKANNIDAFPQFDKNDVIMAEELEKEKLALKDEVEKDAHILDYFNVYKNVIITINNIVPLAIQLLGSKNVSDVNETIELFIVLHKHRINSSFDGVKKMLTLFIKPDESIKKKLIEAYKQLYFQENFSLEMQAAYLIDLALNLNFSEFTCFREMMKLLIESKAIDSLIFKEIWRVFLRNPKREIENSKFADASEAKAKMDSLAKESRIALQILNIAAETDKSILLNNADIFIKFVLGILQRDFVDWLLIKECLVGLQKIYAMKKDLSETCLLKISRTVLRGLGTEDKNWFCATQELIDTIFQIFSSPDQFCQFIIFRMSKPLFKDKENKKEIDQQFSTQMISGRMNLSRNNLDLTQVPGANDESRMDIEEKEESCGYNLMSLSHLIFTLGHIGLNMIIYAEKLEANLKKKKNEKQDKKDKKQEEEDEIDKIGGGKEAEVESDINFLHKIIEDEVLYNNLLSKFTPLIIQLVKNSLTAHITDQNITLYKTAILSLCKFMCISKKFCEENLPLLFQILESSKVNPSLKLNVCVAFGDLVNRFPNVLQTQITNYFNCLKSSDIQVVRHSMIVISHLVLNDMLKLKGEIVEICMLLESQDQRLKDLVNLFFYELNKKGNNVIYNVIPKALAKLNNEYKHLEYAKFQSIVKNLIKYVEKDKQTEGLIDKLFNKLKTSLDSNEWRNTTYCLSLLNYTEKSVNKLLDLYQNLKEKIDDEVVNENFSAIFARFKKNSGNNINKESLEEMEKKFFAGEKISTNVKGNKGANAKGNTNVNKNKLGSKRTHSNMLTNGNKMNNNNKGGKKGKGRGKDVSEEEEENASEDFEEDEVSSNNNNNNNFNRNNNVNNVQTRRNLRSQTNNNNKPANKNKKNYKESVEEDELEEIYNESD